MKSLKYKGLIGTAEYSDTDKIFYGKIVNIDGLVNYEATNVEDLQREFKEAVDYYIAYCKEHNLPLHKSYSGSFNVRLTPELHAKVVEKATNVGVSLNAFIRETLQKAVL